MIHLRDVLLRRGPEPLLEQATFSILRGEKVGIVGRNGSGKSSLLALIQGTLSADRGEFECPAQLRIATVAQELPHSQRPVIEHVIDGDQGLRDCEQRLQEAEQRDDGVAQAEALAQYELQGGYTARSRAAHSSMASASTCNASTNRSLPFRVGCECGPISRER